MDQPLNPQDEIRFIVTNKFLFAWIDALVDLSAESSFASVKDKAHGVFNSMRVFYLIIRPSMVQKQSFENLDLMDARMGIIKGKGTHSIENIDNNESIYFKEYSDMILTFGMITSILSQDFDILLNDTPIFDEKLMSSSPVEKTL